MVVTGWSIRQSDGETMNINEQNQPIDPSQLTAANEYFDEGEQGHYGSVVLHSLDRALKQEKLRSIPYTQNEDGSFKKIHIPVEGGYASVLSDGNVVTTFDPATLKDPTKDTDIYYIVYYSLVGKKRLTFPTSHKVLSWTTFIVLVRQGMKCGLLHLVPLR